MQLFKKIDKLLVFYICTLQFIYIYEKQMTDTEKKQVDPTDILIPEDSTVKYWNQSYTIGKLGMKKILELLKLISRSETKIRRSITENFSAKKLEQEQEVGIEITDAEVNFGTMDYVYSALEAIADNEIYVLVSIILDISKEESEKWFSLWDIVWLILAILEQEDIEKLFLQLNNLAEKTKSLR